MSLNHWPYKQIVATSYKRECDQSSDLCCWSVGCDRLCHFPPAFDVSWVEDEDGFVAGFVHHPECQFGLGFKSECH